MIALNFWRVNSSAWNMVLTMSLSRRTLFCRNRSTSSLMSSEPEPSESNFVKICSMISFYFISCVLIKYCFLTAGAAPGPSPASSCSPGAGSLNLSNYTFYFSHFFVWCDFSCVCSFNRFLSGVGAWNVEAPGK